MLHEKNFVTDNKMLQYLQLRSLTEYYIEHSTGT